MSGTSRSSSLRYSRQVCLYIVVWLLWTILRFGARCFPRYFPQAMAGINTPWTRKGTSWFRFEVHRLVPEGKGGDCHWKIEFVTSHYIVVFRGDLTLLEFSNVFVTIKFTCMLSLDCFDAVDRTMRFYSALWKDTSHGIWTPNLLGRFSSRSSHTLESAMSTAHRPTWDPAQAKDVKGGSRQFSVRDMAAHTKLKFRYMPFLTYPLTFLLLKKTMK